MMWTKWVDEVGRGWKAGREWKSGKGMDEVGRGMDEVGKQRTKCKGGGRSRKSVEERGRVWMKWEK